MSLEGPGLLFQAKLSLGCGDNLILRDLTTTKPLIAELLDVETFKAEVIYAHWREVVERALDDYFASLISSVYDRKVDRFTGVPSKVGRGVDVIAVVDGQRLYLEDLSDGAKTIFAIGLVSSLTPGPTVLLLEEPETHLHPAVQRELSALLAELVKAGHQAIVSTHNAEFMKILLDQPELEARAFHLERDPDGSIYVRQLKKVDVEVLEDLGIDVRYIDIF